MAGSAVVGLLKVLLTADTAEFDSAMKRVSGSANAWAKDLGSIGRQATALGSSLTKTLTLPLLGIGVGAVKAASDFESSFAGVRKTVEATEPEFAKLAQGLRDMAKEIPVNVNELNRVAESAGQLGIKKDDIIAFTRVMADLGVTTNLTADEAATATAQFQNIFGAAGKDVDRFGATLVALGNAGASTEKDIIQMGLRIAGAGHQVGLTQAQVMAFASTLASVGINAEAGGSAISRVFLKINDAVAKGGKDLAEFARISDMTASEFKTVWGQDAAGATAAFINGLGRLKEQGVNVNATIESVIGKNIILKDTLMRAAGAGDLLTDQLTLADQAWQENNALTKEAAERYKTFSSQVTILWNQIKDVAITLGNAMLPAMKDLVNVAKQIVPVVESMVKAFTSLPTWVQASAIGFTALVAVTGPMLFAFGQVVQAAGLIAGAFTAKGIATRALTLLLPGLSTAVTGVGVAATAAAVGVTALKVALAGVVIGGLVLGLSILVDKLRNVGKEVETLSGKPIKGLVDANGKAVMTLNEAADAARGFGTSIITGLNNPLMLTPGLANNTRAAISGLGEDLTKEEKKRLKAIDERKAALREFYNFLGERRMEDEAAELQQIEDQKKFWREYYNWLGERRMEADAAAEAAQRAISEGSAPDWLSGTLEKFKPAIKASGTKTGYEFGTAFKEGFKGILGNIAQTFANAFTGGGNFIGAVKSVVSQVGSMIGGAIGGMFGPIGAQIGSAIGSLAGGLVSGFKRIFGIGINNEVKAANKEIEALKNQLLLTYGTLDKLEELAQKVGLSFKENWGHQGKAGLEAFKKLFDQFVDRIGDMRERLVESRDELEQTLDTANQGLDTLIGKANDLGYVFDREGSLIGFNFDKVKSVADDLGVRFEALGPKFRSAQIATTAAQMVNGLKLLFDAGGDVGGILYDVRQKFSDLVNEAIKSGSKLPAQLKPFIDELFKSGHLVDENGQKLTSLAGLQFGDPIETEFEGVQRAIRESIQAIKDLMARIAELVNAILGIPDKTYTLTEKRVTDDQRTAGDLVGDRDNEWTTGLPPAAAGAVVRRTGAALVHAGELIAPFGLVVDAVRSAIASLPSSMSVMSGLTPALAGSSGGQSGSPVIINNHFEFNTNTLETDELSRLIRRRIMPEINSQLSTVGELRSANRDALGI